MTSVPEKGGSDASLGGPEPIESRRDSGLEAQGGRRLFPYNAVVGVIDDTAQLESAVQALDANGFGEDKVSVLSGEAGVRMIDAKGQRKGLLARIFRVIDALGTEREHTARHVKALEDGHFIVVVDAPDEAAISRARDTLAAHGGHFINYYGRWTEEDLVP
ncbi:MAG TPA: hypothetical protein VJ672_09255 [Gemmatimonadaceae bacterium]|nr:hypothetical protein [Gemmatimonadaceae bacterium]